MRTFACLFCRDVASPLTLFSSPMFPVQRLFSSALLAAALASPALAQTAPADTARSYRHQLGLTASPQLDHFFTANRSLPIGLIYKQQLKPGRALRLRLVGFYSRRDTSSTNHPLFQPLNSSGPNAYSWEVNAFIGYEWQHALSRRFQWLYGLEIGVGYHHEYSPFDLQEYSTGSPNGNPYVVTTSGSRYLHRWQGQGRGFAGFRYLLGSRLTLFAETALLLTYENQKRGGEYSTFFSNGMPAQIGGSFYDITNKNLLFNWHPVQLLGLTASF